MSHALLSLISAFAFFLSPAQADDEESYSGFVTPTSMTIGFTEVKLRKVDGKLITLISGAFTHEFLRDGSDLKPAVLNTKVTVPHGRYIGAQVCYDTNRYLTLEGVKYEGKSGGGISDGDLLYSIGSDALKDGSLTKTNPGTGGVTRMSGYLYSLLGNHCYDDYYPVPVCVGGASRCESGDAVVDPAQTVPSVNLIYDLYHSVAVNAEKGKISNGVYLFPFAAIGPVGAGIHLSASGAGNARAGISLLFDSNKRLLRALSYGQADSGFCEGIGLVSVLENPVPADKYRNVSGPTAVNQLDTTGTGKLMFAASPCAGNNSCSSRGVMRVNGFIKPQGQTLSVDCLRDENAIPPYLGFGYKTGAGGAGGSSTFTIQRIVDPNGIFGQCTGTCGAYP